MYKLIVKPLLILFTFLIANYSFGADWGLLESSRGEFYYDRGSINKSVNNGVTTIKFNLLSQQETPIEINNKYFLSETWSLVVACETNKYTLGYKKYYSQRWASGSMVEKKDAYDNWQGIPFGPLFDLKMKFCR